MLTDLGTIRNKTALPIKQLQFGGLKYDLQQVVFGLYSISSLTKIIAQSI